MNRFGKDLEVPTYILSRVQITDFKIAAEF